MESAVAMWLIVHLNVEEKGGLTVTHPPLRRSSTSNERRLAGDGAVLVAQSKTSTSSAMI